MVFRITNVMDFSTSAPLPRPKYLTAGHSFRLFRQLCQKLASRRERMKPSF